MGCGLWAVGCRLGLCRALSCSVWFIAEPQEPLVKEPSFISSRHWGQLWCLPVRGCPLDGKLSSVLDRSQPLCQGEVWVWNGLVEIQFHPVHKESSEWLQSFWRCQPARANPCSFLGRWWEWVCHRSSPTEFSETREMASLEVGKELNFLYRCCWVASRVFSHLILRTTLHDK